jgi:hypothetical protein
METMGKSHRWVQAELRCLLCGRLLGRVAGAARSRSLAVDRSAFAVFRPSDPLQPIRRLRGDERFRCDACGGPVIIDELEHFATDDEWEEAPAARRPGRRQTPMRRVPDSRLVQFGFAS